MAAYINIRVLDELRRLLDASVNAFAESLRISQNQYNAGIVSAADVAQARTQVESTRARAIAVAIQRAQLETAIAVLIGKPPAELSVPPAPRLPILPRVPAGLPSSLLERRPDISAAERRMAAANAEIGVAATAFYPDIVLSAEAGTAAAEIAKLVSASSRLWSFGSTLVQTVFDAGARHARVEQAVATFDRSVALYRQTVLDALREVEDQLAALRILAEQAAALDEAVTASREAERIISNQYLAGTVSFTDVVVAQDRGAQQCTSGARCDAGPAARGGRADRGTGRRLGGFAIAEPRAGRGAFSAQPQPAAAPDCLAAAETAVTGTSGPCCRCRVFRDGRMAALLRRASTGPPRSPMTAGTTSWPICPSHPEPHPMHGKNPFGAADRTPTFVKRFVIVHQSAAKISPRRRIEPSTCSCGSPGHWQRMMK